MYACEYVCIYTHNNHCFACVCVCMYVCMHICVYVWSNNHPMKVESQNLRNGQISSPQWSNIISTMVKYPLNNGQISSLQWSNIISSKPSPKISTKTTNKAPMRMYVCMYVCIYQPIKVESQDLHKDNKQSTHAYVCVHVCVYVWSSINP
jgi:hypothetical protein